MCRGVGLTGFGFNKVFWDKISNHNKAWLNVTRFAGGLCKSSDLGLCFCVLAFILRALCTILQWCAPLYSRPAMSRQDP